jgi:threonine aldolase
MATTRPIDLRSDTVTRPTKDMLAAMARAELGDDVLGDDPTVIRLQERFAERLGKPAACFVPSGTMANQTSIRAHTEHGDEVIAHSDSHIIHYETGSPAALSGCMIRPLSGAKGQFDAADVEAAARPDSVHAPRSRLLVVENTQNRGGGSVWAIDKIKRVTSKGRELGLRLHLDGARLWNASIASGLNTAEYAKHFDTISCCFSKGLGSPAGSAVAGDVDTIRRVHRFRKMFGGAMRQAGILAAAALYAMDHHFDRLAEDHANARRLAEGIAHIPGLSLDREQAAGGVETNIIFFDLAADLSVDAPQLCARLKAQGVLMLPPGPRRIRAVTHLDVTRDMIDQALRTIEQALNAPVRA